MRLRHVVLSYIGRAGLTLHACLFCAVCMQSCVCVPQIFDTHGTFSGGEFLYSRGRRIGVHDRGWHLPRREPFIRYNASEALQALRAAPWLLFS